MRYQVVGITQASILNIKNKPKSAYFMKSHNYMQHHAYCSLTWDGIHHFCLHATLLHDLEQSETNSRGWLYSEEWREQRTDLLITGSHSSVSPSYPERSNLKGRLICIAWKFETQRKLEKSTVKTKQKLDVRNSFLPNFNTASRLLGHYHL